MSATTDPAMSIPAGSTVLVSGATGYLASEAIRQLLERGFRVRGSVRDLHSASWLLTTHHKEAQSGQLELVKVPDIGVEGAFDEAVKGISGVLHIATDALLTGGDFSTDPELAIPVTVKSMSSIFMSTLKEKTIKKFVFTGSIIAAVYPSKGIDTVVGPDTFNEAAVSAAYAPPPFEPTRGLSVYAAGKVAAEKEFLRLMKEHQPGFSGNIVSPSGIIGEPRHVKHVDNHHNWVTTLYRGNQQRLDSFPCAFFIDVKDVALVHVAALLDSEVENQRIQAWGNSVNWNIFLKILRRLRPEKQWIADFPNPGFLDISTDHSIAQGLLQKWGNQDDWTTLSQTLDDGLNNPYFKFGVEN